MDDDDDDDDFDQPLSGSRYRHLEVGIVCRNAGRPNGQHCVRHAEPIAAVAETAAPLPSALHQQDSTSEIDAVESKSQSIGTSLQADVATATDEAAAIDVIMKPEDKPCCDALEQSTVHEPRVDLTLRSNNADLGKASWHTDAGVQSDEEMAEARQTKSEIKGHSNEARQPRQKGSHSLLAQASDGEEDDDDRNEHRSKRKRRRSRHGSPSASPTLVFILSTATVILFAGWLGFIMLQRGRGTTMPSHHPIILQRPTAISSASQIALLPGAVPLPLPHPKPTSPSLPMIPPPSPAPQSPVRAPVGPPLPPPPPPPPPYPSLPPPAVPPPCATCQRINARFQRRPFDRTMWHSDGALADAGVLVHCLDRYEDPDQPWRPNTGMVDISASLIFAEQPSLGGAAPVFGSCSEGIVFAPGSATHIRCGNG